MLFHAQRPGRSLQTILVTLSNKRAGVLIRPRPCSSRRLKPLYHLPYDQNQQDYDQDGNQV